MPWYIVEWCNKHAAEPLAWQHWTTFAGVTMALGVQQNLEYVRGIPSRIVTAE